MAKISDSSAIQYRTLNTKKGPAVHSTRTQNDKSIYHKNMKLTLEKASNLDIKQAMVEDFIIEKNKIKGVYDHTGFSYFSKTIVLCTGTFLKGVVHIGSKEINAGRAGEFSSIGLANSLAKTGFSIGRMKTGTPPRLHLDSVDLTQFDTQYSNSNPIPFSFSNKKHLLPLVPSYMGRTNQKTHDLIRKNLKHSALYGGHIKGKSARYCPSFEDKIVKFPERESHRVILEYEGLDTKEIYASGLGNSLPLEIQIEFVRSVKGLDQAEIMRPGYAIEYDYINPLELSPTLETKRIKGLFFAGQVNGTSGYEEAAAQGLWAGINAACKVQLRPDFILDRSQAYIGVMIDDLVTRGTSEPYRMFTSRAEYRLVLREDNADLRLSQIGNELGLVDDDTLKSVKELNNNIKKEINRIKKCVIKPSKDVNQYLKDMNTSTITNGIHLDNLLKRFELSYSAVDKLDPNEKSLNMRIKRQVEIEIKYEGYIARQFNEIKKYKDMEKIKIPEKLDFKVIPGLSNELVEKLSKIKPFSLGQASRIDGITPAAISVIMIAISAYRQKSSS